jgi:hypothetical protein
VHVGLRTVLSRCPPLPLSSGEEEEDDDDDEGEEGREEAQELDIDLDQDEGDEDDDDVGLVDPDIQQPTQELPDEEVGFRTASGRVVRLSRVSTDKIYPIWLRQKDRSFWANWAFDISIGRSRMRTLSIKCGSRASIYI